MSYAGGGARRRHAARNAAKARSITRPHVTRRRSSGFSSPWVGRRSMRTDLEVRAANCSLYGGCRPGGRPRSSGTALLGSGVIQGEEVGEGVVVGDIRGEAVGGGYGGV